ncbi:MAG: GHMP kinase [Flavobacteriaceae bacterium]|nr:GHMP kinase [Flavobacteriaceae bacterium]
MKTYYSNGKLLLTGEYLVLDGALSLAVPTQFGQSLTVETVDKPKLIWKSIDNNGNVWFKKTFDFDKMLNQVQHDDDISKRLVQILHAVKQLNPNFLNSEFGYKVTAKLDFPQFWGLGSSSTLINNIAQWANVDAYQLLEQTFGGSGYDIACAQHNVPITYQLTRPINSTFTKVSADKCAQGDNTLNDKKRKICKIDFNPEFKNNLFFVHLNKKQNSRDGIEQYNANKNNFSLAISEISDVTSNIISCNSLEHFETLISSHEQIISKIIKQKPIKELLFNDYKGTIKSLGAWGGDFILATGNKNSIDYFRRKGYNTIITYDNMVLN